MKKVVFQDKLTWVGRQADFNFWDAHWLQANRGLLYKSRLPWYVRYAIKGIQARACILEAGCGSGFIVNGLARRKFEVYGVDNAEKTIRTLRDSYPDIHFSCQDVRNLTFEDSKFDAYLSLGVIEHFADEKESLQVIKEAVRVTKPNAVVFISVPYINSLRERKIKKGIYKAVERIPAEFYQCAYTFDQFKGLFLKSPLKLTGTIYYGADEGICREVESLNFLRKNFVTRMMLKAIEQYTRFLEPYTHMIGFKLQNTK